MPRVSYAIGVVRWPLVQWVASALLTDQEGTDTSPSKILRNAFDARSQDFALYASFLDGWDRCHLLHDGAKEVSLFGEINAEEMAPRLHILRRDQLTPARAAFGRVRTTFLEASAKRLDDYAIEALLHWMFIGFGFVESTGLPMLMAYDVIGPSIGDEGYRPSHRT